DPVNNSPPSTAPAHIIGLRCELRRHLVTTVLGGIMAGKPRPIPEGYHTVTPYLIVKGAAEAIEFYKNAFGASELFRFPGPGGKIMHAEIKIGDSPIMLADEMPEMDA